MDWCRVIVTKKKKREGAGPGAARAAGRAPGRLMGVVGRD